MQRSTLIFSTIAIVVVGALCGSDAGSRWGTGSASSFSPCTDSIKLRTYYDQSNQTLVTTAFLVAPGSTVKVCITYPTEGSTTGSPSTGPLACGSIGGAIGSALGVCSGQLTVVASALFLNHSAGSNVTVAYLLRASENAEGVYWFWVDCGEVLPLAVGTLPSSLTFPIIAGCVYEPNAPGRGSVTGFSDMGVEKVRIG